MYAHSLSRNLLQNPQLENLTFTNDFLGRFQALTGQLLCFNSKIVMIPYIYTLYLV